MDYIKLTKELLVNLDELNDKIITEFIGLKLKLYPYLILDSKNKQKKIKVLIKIQLKKICFNDLKKLFIN